MSEPEQLVEGVDPESSPFAAPPIEGMPYERGSDEDHAVGRIIGDADDS
jgi:hypothetical protein